LFLSLYEEGSTIPGWVTEWGSLCVNHPWVGDRVGVCVCQPSLDG